MVKTRTVITVAVLSAAALLTCACSTGRQAGEIVPASTRSPAVPKAQRSSPAPPPSRPAPGFSRPAAACPLLPIGDIEQVSGQSGLTTEEIPVTSSDPGETLRGCFFVSPDYPGHPAGSITVSIRPAAHGVSARQYLASDIAASQYNYGLSRDVPGLGGAAKFGTAKCYQGVCASVWLVEIRGGTLADVHVTVTDPSGAENGVLAIGRTLLARLTI